MLQYFIFRSLEWNRKLLHNWAPHVGIKEKGTWEWSPEQQSRWIRKLLCMQIFEILHFSSNRCRTQSCEHFKLKLKVLVFLWHLIPLVLDYRLKRFSFFFPILAQWHGIITPRDVWLTFGNAAAPIVTVCEAALSAVNLGRLYGLWIKPVQKLKPSQIDELILKWKQGTEFNIAKTFVVH